MSILFAIPSALFGQILWKYNVCLNFRVLRANVLDVNIFLAFYGTFKVLSALYERILRTTSQMPESAAYRKNVDEIVKSRLSVINTVGTI